MPIHLRFFAVILFTLPLWATAYALGTGKMSVSNFFGTSESNEKKVEETNSENIQTLEVLNKNFFADLGDRKHKDVNHTQEMFNADMTAFEIPENIIDSKDGGTEDGKQKSFYTVVAGDNINSVAEYFKVTVDTIVTYNKLSSKTLTVGQKLEIPEISGVLYEVKKGDTLLGISKKYSIDLDDVTLYNQIFDDSDIAIGDEIFLPHAKQIDIKIKNAKVKSSNPLASKNSKWEKGDTSHLNTNASIKKYSALTKFAGYYIFPSPGAVRTQKMHGQNATDLANKLGSPVLASAEGVVRVAKSGSYNFGYGNYIIISHPNGTETLYAHNQTLLVSPGQTVSKGQQIATIGSTGNSTGPHVHFEIRGAYNPFAW
jgi:murein DD-endopeptidase MepM/ murein hydrolase activator NlpD